MKYFQQIILAFSIILASCHPEKEQYQTYTKSYVLSYHDIENIKLLLERDGIIAVYVETSGEWYSKSRNKSHYDYLCEKHYDLYKRKIWASVHGTTHSFIAQDFVTVEVVSDNDFDEGHPAGSSLADITDMYSCSVYAYIRNGYQDFDWNNYPDQSSWASLFERISGYSIKMGNFYPIKKNVQKLTPNDLRILGQEGMSYGTGLIGFIVFNSQPSLDKDHNVTITFTDDEGNVFKSSVLVDFE